MIPRRSVMSAPTRERPACAKRIEGFCVHTAGLGELHEGLVNACLTPPIRVLAALSDN